MTKWKYTIEANNKTLARFMGIVGTGEIGQTFVHRVTPDKNEEYYYIVLTATNQLHTELIKARFNNRQQQVK